METKSARKWFFYDQFFESFFFWGRGRGGALLVIAQKKNLLGVYSAQLYRLLPAVTKG